MNPSASDLIPFSMLFMDDVAVLSNTEFTSGFQNVRGQARIIGSINSTAIALAANDYPRVEFSANGIDVDYYEVVGQDPGPGPAGFIYKFDVRNLSRFARILWKSAVPSRLHGACFAEPRSGGPIT